ncbi:MAG: ligand-binding sensor domain-containing protein [Saprospiraceae bacterium]|jgi:ligand-binding sensor domain-containing protein
MKIFIFLALIFGGFISQGQVGIGEWREHLSYRNGVALCKAGNRIYCSTSPSLFYYDTEDNSIQKVSKVQGLSDLEINVIKYSEKHNTVIIGYNNGNVDLIVNNQIINVPDIKRSFIQADKSVNEIILNGDLAYLSTGFGIIALDLVKKEISETFNLGAGGAYLQVNESCIKNDTIYAACADGIYYGSLNDNLIDFQKWIKMGGLPNGNYNTIVAINDKLICNFQFKGGWEKDTIYSFEGGNWQKKALGNNYKNNNVVDLNVFDQEVIASLSYSALILDENLIETNTIWQYEGTSYSPEPREIIKDENNYWIADRNLALIQWAGGAQDNIIIPTGPYFSSSWGMDYSDGKLWIGTGSLTETMKNNYGNKGIAQLDNNAWKNYYGGAFDSLLDIHSVAIHPDNNEHVFAASWFGGLLEFKDGKRVKIFNETNSSVQSIALFPWRGIGGLNFDQHKNLWMSNSGLVGAPITNPLVVYDNELNWYSFNLNGLLNGAYNFVSDVIIDKQDNKWIVAYQTGLFVFNENGTLSDDSDDQTILLTVGESTGNLPSNEVMSIAEGHDGKIYIGTSAGLAVINNTNTIFEVGTTKAEKIIIEEEGEANYLLSDEAITDIKIDAANRKWIGTKNSGVYLMNASMNEELYHFTSTNSPLLSDAIIDIEINDESGEVYFSTEKGLVSFMGSATDSDNYDGPIYAYPNPVPPNYNGVIGIKGLPNNSEIKITDVLGNLVYETIANGGTATWDGHSLNGRKAQSGVYIVFASNSDGSKTEITKILFLN